MMVPLIITSSFGGADSNHQVYGVEAEYLTSSAYLASKNLDQLGYIPHWEPNLGFGEPLIDSPFSFVTNPLSIGPSLVWAAAVGIRVSIILEAILAAIHWKSKRLLHIGEFGRTVMLNLLITTCIAAAWEVNARWPIMVTAVPPEKTPAYVWTG